VEDKSTNPPQNVKDWLKWAKEKQVHLDPLSSGTGALIEEYLIPTAPQKYGCF